MREACNAAGTPRGNWATSFLRLEGATRAESVNAARWINPHHSAGYAALNESSVHQYKLSLKEDTC